ncbi:hypothetical protein A2415_04500 [candidate division WWE3 bacterium RIFOXYC1_FULL_39_7]|uniref:Uncharacterized protein n=1 Tax=candidate division WWE3 bacterium RIFOXYC1_FULL_39_7 TaxID=1802643 RepID=A0A1F4WFT9_UNCKA|nr:MAG: hypothetical protein A2415_04500 [candidate division WWE3 bacterium RIFOXYC1_FULL_39_7]
MVATINAELRLVPVSSSLGVGTFGQIEPTKQKELVETQVNANNTIIREIPVIGKWLSILATPFLLLFDIFFSIGENIGQMVKKGLNIDFVGLFVQGFQKAIDFFNPDKGTTGTTGTTSAISGELSLDQPSLAFQEREQILKRDAQDLKDFDKNILKTDEFLSNLNKNSIENISVVKKLNQVKEDELTITKKFVGELIDVVGVIQEKKYKLGTASAERRAELEAQGYRSRGSEGGLSGRMASVEDVKDRIRDYGTGGRVLNEYYSASKRKSMELGLIGNPEYKDFRKRDGSATQINASRKEEKSARQATAFSGRRSTRG